MYLPYTMTYMTKFTFLDNILKNIPRLELNILPGIIGSLLFSKSELKFYNSEFNFSKLPKCDEITFPAPTV